MVIKVKFKFNEIWKHTVRIRINKISKSSVSRLNVLKFLLMACFFVGLGQFSRFTNNRHFIEYWQIPLFMLLFAVAALIVLGINGMCPRRVIGNAKEVQLWDESSEPVSLKWRDIKGINTRKYGSLSYIEIVTEKKNYGFLVRTNDKLQIAVSEFIECMRISKGI